MGDYHRSTINVTLDQKKVDALGYFKDPVCLAAIRDEAEAKKLLDSDNPIDRAFAQIYRTSLLWPGDIDPGREDCRNTSEFGANFSLRVHYEGKAYTADIRKAFKELAPVLVYEEGKVVCVWGEEFNEGFVVYLMVGGKLVESPYFGFYSARHRGEPYPEFDFMVSGEGNTVITLTIPELKKKFPEGKWPPAELESDGKGWLQVAETLPGFDVIYDYTKEIEINLTEEEVVWYKNTWLSKYHRYYRHPHLIDRDILESIPPSVLALNHRIKRGPGRGRTRRRLSK